MFHMGQINGKIFQIQFGKRAFYGNQTIMFRNLCFYKNKAKQLKKIIGNFTSLQIIYNNAQSAQFYKLIQKKRYILRIKMMHG